jgi:hypothetical protein
VGNAPRPRDPLQSAVHGAVLALVIGWVLHVGNSLG